MTIEYRGRTFTVEPTGIEREPYRLVGRRGGALTLVRDGSSRTRFFVKTADGKMQSGCVGLLNDGRLVWLTAGPNLAQWRRERSARRAA